MRTPGRAEARKARVSSWFPVFLGSSWIVGAESSLAPRLQRTPRFVYAPAPHAVPSRIRRARRRPRRRGDAPRGDRRHAALLRPLLLPLLVRRGVDGDVGAGAGRDPGGALPGPAGH